MVVTVRRGVAAGLLGCLVLTAGCESRIDGNGRLEARPSTTASPTEDPSAPVRLTVWLTDQVAAASASLLAGYRKSHPNVTVQVQRIAEPPEVYWARVQQQLNMPVAGTDLFSINSAQMGEVVGDSELWADLARFGAIDLADEYYPSSWAAALAPGGKVMGLGVDLGPTAMCFRRDLLTRAGLPGDREALARLWTDWPAYLATGRQFAAATGSAGVSFVDSPDILFRAILSGAQTQYYDRDGKPVYATNPEVRRAWDLAVQAVGDHLAGTARPFTAEWDAALRTGRVATLPCAPWTVQFMKGVFPEAAGKWDVAAPPAAGNWGGSFLSVPANSANQRAAYELAEWLTAPEQHAAAYPSQQVFPARRTAAQQPPVARATEPYVGNAPVGEIFSAVADDVPAAPGGPKTEVITSQLTQALGDVAHGRASPDRAWQQALAKIKSVVDD